MTVTIPGGMTQSNLPLQGKLGRQQVEYLKAEFTAKKAMRDTRRALVVDEGTAIEYLDEIEPLIAQCLLPPNITPGPLNVVVTGTLDRTGYKVDKLYFESLPGWYVSANFYWPDSAETVPAPGVVLTCGHDWRSKWFYSDFAAILAKLGYCVLIFDPLGQGERLQVPTQPVAEHKLIGRQLALSGLTLAGLMTHDGMRAVEYLLTRPEVDPNVIGVSGNSGGGTTAVWLAALDDRITMAAPSCFGNTWLELFKNEIWADYEQSPFPAAKLGLDFDDFIATCARLQKPYVMICQALDFFTKRDSIRMHTWGAHVYDMVGATGKLVLHMGPGKHGFGANGWNAALALFSTVTGLGVTSPVPFFEPPVPPAGPPTTFPVPVLNPQLPLDVIPERDMALLPGGMRTTGLFTLIADQLAIERGEPRGAELITRVRNVLQMPNESLRSVPPDFGVWQSYTQWTLNGTSITPPITPPNYPKSYACVYAVESEPAIQVPTYYITSVVVYSEPPFGTSAIVYIPHQSADQELSQPQRELLITQTVSANPTTPFFASDVRGSGESITSSNAVLSALPLGDDYCAMAYELCGIPMMGRMVWDLLRVLDMLASYGYTDIHLMGRGNGAIVAALAALLEPNVTRVTLKNSLSRWDGVLRAVPTEYVWPMSRMPFGVLKYFDLPDVYAELLATKTEFIQLSPWGPWGAQGGL